jgi:putative membrane protein
MRSSKIALTVAFAFALALPWAAAQQDNNQTQQSADTSKSADKSTKPSAGALAGDIKFLKQAADGGLSEVELGKLATEKASNNDVKQFGQRMVDDHGKANDQLKQLAAQKNIDLPSAPGAKNKATKARLEKLSGEEFDRAYIATMLKDHKKDVAEFRRESRSAQDPDVKNFAGQTLPTLEDHLKQVEGLSGASGKSTSAANPAKSQ